MQQNQLTVSALRYVFSFLNQRDIAITEKVSQLWRQISLFAVENKLIQFSAVNPLIPSNQMASNYLDWCIKHLKVMSIPFDKFCIYINFTDSVEKIQTITSLIQTKKLWIYDHRTQVQEKDGSFESQILDSQGKTNILEKLTVNSEFYIKYIDKIPTLNQLTMRGCKYYEGNGLKNLNPMRSLSLCPQSIEFDHLLPLLEKSTDQLIEISLDGENLNSKQLRLLISMLNPEIVRKFAIKYANEFGNDDINGLYKFSKLRTLKFRRAISVTSECFYEVVKAKQFKKLNLMGCEYLNDLSVLEIARNSSQTLIRLDLSWCSQLTNESVQSQLFAQCGSLQIAIFTGCKNLTEKCLPQIAELYRECNIQSDKQIVQPKYSQEECILYQRLKLLDFQKCDFIPDQCLVILKYFRPYLKIYNYYGEKIKLY